jgi:hypothetical protein
MSQEITEHPELAKYYEYYQKHKDETGMDLETYLASTMASIERSRRRKEEKKKEYEADLDFLDQFFHSSEVKGTILKLSPYDDDSPENMSSFDYYKMKTGVSVLKERTLILGTEDNESLLVFLKEDVKLIEGMISSISIIGTYKYDEESCIRNKLPPARIPDYLRSVIFINNIDSNIPNIQDEQVLGFLRKNYNPGGMYPLTLVRKHPEWIPRYRHHITIERIHLCKSCGNKSMSNCCPEYDPKNRKMLLMVIGWH